MKKWRINNTELEFNEIYYVDADNGNDDNDGLTVATAFKTIYKYTTTTFYDKTACILLDGVHKINKLSDLVLAAQEYEQSIIGNGINTKIEANEASTSVVITRTKTISFYRLVILVSEEFSGTMSSFFSISSNSTYNNLNAKFYNVGFLKNKYPTLRFFSWHSTDNNTGDTSQFYNCAVNASYFLTKTINTSATNCAEASASTSGILTTNLTTGTGKIDNNFNILVSGWRNAGTGENPDGTQAHIGVYGGPFAWANESIAWGNLLTISDEDRIIGEFTESPSVTYQISEEAPVTSIPITVTESVNNTPFRYIFDAIRNEDYVLTIPSEQFIQLDNQDSALSVHATNGTFSATRIFTFARKIEKIDVQTVAVTTIRRTQRVEVNIQYEAPAENVTILVCNNALDNSPTWETTENGEMHVFSNTEKENINWAIAVRVIIERNDENLITLSEINYLYE